MTWEYRVVRHTRGCDEDRFVYFDICEVYDSGLDMIIWTTDFKPAVGDTVDELKTDLKRMLEAFDLPVLEKKGDTLVKVEKL